MSRRSTRPDTTRRRTQTREACGRAALLPPLIGIARVSVGGSVVVALLAAILFLGLGRRRLGVVPDIVNKAGRDLFPIDAGQWVANEIPGEPGQLADHGLQVLFDPG